MDERQTNLLTGAFARCLEPGFYSDSEFTVDGATIAESARSLLAELTDPVQTAFEPTVIALEERAVRLEREFAQEYQTFSARGAVIYAPWLTGAKIYSVSDGNNPSAATYITPEAQRTRARELHVRGELADLLPGYRAQLDGIWHPEHTQAMLQAYEAYAQLLKFQDPSVKYERYHLLRDRAESAIQRAKEVKPTPSTNPHRLVASASDLGAILRALIREASIVIHDDPDI